MPQDATRRFKDESFPACKTLAATGFQSPALRERLGRVALRRAWGHLFDRLWAIRHPRDRARIRRRIVGESLHSHGVLAALMAVSLAQRLLQMVV